MTLITGCKLYVDQNLTTVGYALEETRRRAAPYIHNRRALKIESCVASAPTQVWAYDYAIEAWVLQRSLVANDGDHRDRSCGNPSAQRQP
jgi:hypothetical protein